jgi:hypothetical protein
MEAWEAAGIYPNHPLLVSSDTLLQFVTPVDASNSATITLTNKGLHPLTIQEFNVGDTLNYELVNPPALPLELNGLDHVQLEIKFTPAAQGIHPDTIVITGTDSGDFNQVIYLSGEGISFPTGLPASSIDAGLIIYPNPVNNLLTIETHISDTYYIEILTLGGQPVLLEEMRGTTAKLDLSPFRRGVYFIHIRSAELVATRKIIKL